MQAYRLETTLGKDKAITLTGLPFPEGQELEVIVLEHSTSQAPHQYPLRGKPIKYIDPTEPVAVEDWEALK
ncbi:MAG: hypothetical protein NTX50_02325 [Candidatus Sumerlaeota bacterium]|nr:hypothetical protein [Candidatus Sumerlaeota bacterium]